MAETPKGGVAQFPTHPQEPSNEAESSKTKHLASVPPPSQEITHHPNVPDVTVQPWTLELTLSPEPETQVVGSSPIQQDQPTLSLEHREEIVAQSPVYNQVTVDSTGQGQGQKSKLRDVIVSLLDLPLTTTPQFTAEIKHSIALEETAPPTKQSTLKSFTETRALQTASPPNQVTVQLRRSTCLQGGHQHSVPRTEVILTYICELCVCQNAMSSCIGLQKEKKKLRRVPVPEPNTYNGIFTVFVIVQPADLALTTTPQFTSKTEQSTALQKNTLPTKHNTVQSFIQNPLWRLSLLQSCRDLHLQSTLMQHSASTEAALSSPVT
ncbi:PREDICTED: leucine-rich repeat-containing protein 37B-like [Elephantulus edwardii]|uniref:leucine-rich repeat-containing protein 37B-like n=1 Tax=Elephantulus edwardii TaxID=28737 RepID=UPI0003F08762|nr:PREDICTED: leucine-rich repeat-containing protein 37B-like [Elephantulus edwardii]